MPEGAKKSRRFRRVHKKTPGGRNVLHYEKRKPSKAQCAECGGVLAGVPNMRKAKLSQLSRTEKRPSRPFGGVLCSSCMRKHFVEQARSK